MAMTGGKAIVKFLDLIQNLLNNVVDVTSHCVKVVYTVSHSDIQEYLLYFSFFFYFIKGAVLISNFRSIIEIY